MGINSLNFNNGYYSSNGRGISTAYVTNGANEVNGSPLPLINADNSVLSNNSSPFLIEKNQNNISNLGPNTEDRAFTGTQNGNFFLQQSANQASPMQYQFESNAPKRKLMFTGLDKAQSPTNKDNQKDDNILLRGAVGALTPIRRAESINDEVKQGNLIPALGAIGLTAINFPEDLRDIGTAWHQIESKIHGVHYEGAYDYMKYQHEFSFFRGTLLQFLTDRSKHPELADRLINLDTSLLNTSWGYKILDLLHVTSGPSIKIKKFNKATNTWEFAKDINGYQRFASSFKGNLFGEMTARALSRTTLIGTGVFALMELYNITKAATKGDTVGDKSKNAAKQTVKSGINMIFSTAGIAYGGAIGAKYGKGLGSLFGMGLGAVLGNEISKKAQGIID